MSIQLNERETAAVLAGLRLLQHWIEGTDPDGEGIQDILDAGGLLMSIDDINYLCESINTQS